MFSTLMYYLFFVFPVLILILCCWILLTKQRTFKLTIGEIKIAKITFTINIFDKCAEKPITIQLHDVIVILTSCPTTTDKDTNYIHSMLWACMLRYVAVHIHQLQYIDIKSTFFKSAGYPDIRNIHASFATGQIYHCNESGRFNVIVTTMKANCGFITCKNGDTYYWSFTMHAKRLALTNPKSTQHLLQVKAFSSFLTKNVDALRLATDADEIKVAYNSYKRDSNVEPKADIVLYSLEIRYPNESMELTSDQLNLLLVAKTKMSIELAFDRITVEHPNYRARLNDVQCTDKLKARQVYVAMGKVGVTFTRVRTHLCLTTDILWFHFDDHSADSALLGLGLIIWAQFLCDNKYTLTYDQAVLAHDIHTSYREFCENLRKIMLTELP